MVLTDLLRGGYVEDMNRLKKSLGRKDESCLLYEEEEERDIFLLLLLQGVKEKKVPLAKEPH